MMASKKTKPAEQEIPALLIDTVCRRLSENKRVRRTLPEKGRLHIDRQLPFLCVYRRPGNRDDLGTERLVKGEASYLVAPGSSRHRHQLTALVRSVVKTLVAEYGAFLIVEIWAGPDGGEANDPSVPHVPPTFQVVAPRSTPLSGTVDVLVRGLRRIKVLKQSVEVEVVRARKRWPPDMYPLLEEKDALELHCSVLGLIVPPVYRDAKSGQTFPMLLHGFRRSLSRTLKRMFYDFAHSRSTQCPPHFQELGRRAVVKAVWEVDRRLSEVSNAFDFLLQLTPVNSDEAWSEFKKTRCERTPEFHYRATPFDPGDLKRQLYQIPLDRVEDPTLEHVFQEKQEELDRKIGMLRDRDTPRFLYGSLQLYGNVEDDLLKLATELLDRVPSRSRDESTKGQLDAEAFADRARAECDHYRSVDPTFSATVEVTEKVPGMMVSQGALLINHLIKVPLSRVDALLQHEVGTHLLTYSNGRAQPFRQLYCGLAGYEDLQEGLAVLAEYLVGGLSRPRMRQLAARVVAARQRIDGASFVDTFRTLHRTYRFSQQNAFFITMRIYRGGGLTKDAVYLRGLHQVLEYLCGGGELDLLFVGKIAIHHIPLIRELQMRQILKPTLIRPRYMECRTAAKRLSQLQNGQGSVLALVDKPDSTLT